MQDKESNGKNEEIVAAYSIFYGLNDKRNMTEKVNLKQNQDLNHVYTMVCDIPLTLIQQLLIYSNQGAIRALEKCENEDTVLSIHTGNKDIQTGKITYKYNFNFD